MMIDYFFSQWTYDYGLKWMLMIYDLYYRLDIEAEELKMRLDEIMEMLRDEVLFFMRYF